VDVDEIFEQPLDPVRRPVGEHGGRRGVDVVARIQAQQSEQPLVLVGEVLVGQRERRGDVPVLARSSARRCW